jgi:cytochrome c-type biogenesis protein
VSGYLNSFGYNQESISREEDTETEEPSKAGDQNESKDGTVTEDNTIQEGSQKKEVIPAFDFTLTDQYGNEHTLSEYQGKVVFINFWATWCPPCKKEMPDIEELYKEYNLNQEEVIFLGIANPSTTEHPNNSDVSIDEIKTFLEDNEYTFPTLFDETGEILKKYNISAFPTTFMIDKEGNIFGYVPGMMTKDIMVNIINQTLQADQ